MGVFDLRNGSNIAFDVPILEGVFDKIVGIIG